MLTALVVSMLAASPGLDQTRAQTSAPAFRLLRAGGGVTQILPAPLDVLFASEMTGNWFSLRGDGTTAGPLALSAVGSPTSQTDRVCPNGPDCGAVTSQRVSSGNNFAASDGSGGPTGDFSTCAVVNVDSTSPTYQVMVAKGAGTTGTNAAFYFAIHGSGVEVYVSNGTTNSLIGNATTGLVTPGAWHFICLSYDYVANGTSLAKIYVDATQVASTASALGPPATVADPYTVGVNSGASVSPMAGRIASAFVTHKALSVTTITAMATAVLPSLQGSRGEAVTTTRSTVRTCCTSAACTLLPANRPCVQGAAVDVAGQRQNLLKQSGALDDSSAWTVTNVTVSADAALALDGTKTADKLTATTTAVTEFRQDAVVNATSATCSGYVKQGSGANDGNRFAIRNQTLGSTISSAQVDLSTGAITYSIGSTGASAESLGGGWWRVAVTAAITSGNTVRCSFGFAGFAETAGEYSYWKDTQLEVGSVATPVCPTTTASAVCNADAVTVPTPASLSQTEGCARFCFTPSWSSFNPSAAASVLLYGNSAGTARIAYSNVNDQNLNVYDGTHIASVAAGFSAGVRKCYVTRWSAARNKMRIENESSGAFGESAAFSTLGTLDPTLMVGSYVSGGSASSVSNGRIDDLSFGSNWSACR